VAPHSGGQAFARLLVTIVTVLSIPSATRAQEADVQLRLEVTQSGFRVGEPVRVCVALVNRGGESVQFRPMSLLTQTMRFSIRSGDGGPFEPYLLGIAVDPGSPLDLAPGGTYRTAQLIHFNYRTDGPAFPVPGRYTIRGEYPNYLSVKRRPAPADVAIEITAPDAPEQAGAAVFSRRSTADFLSGTSDDAGVRNQLGNLASQTPRSVFSLYSRFYLALHTARRYPDKPVDYPGAVRLMSEADTPGFQLLPEVLLHLARWSRQIAGASGASRYMERLNREFPRSCAAFEASLLQARDSSPRQKKSATCFSY
jgi:hypothetical protein